MRQVALIAHDIRSTHNVGALLRTADCFGIQNVYLTGYTPYPLAVDDTRLPHIADKLAQQINKTALGAEHSVDWQHIEDIRALIAKLRDTGYTITGLEQAEGSTPLPDWQPDEKVAILLGREVEGIEPTLLQLCDNTVEIPQFGTKESLNVAQAAAVALYHTRFAPFS